MELLCGTGLTAGGKMTLNQHTDPPGSFEMLRAGGEMERCWKQAGHFPSTYLKEAKSNPHFLPKKVKRNK